MHRFLALTFLILLLIPISMSGNFPSPAHARSPVLTQLFDLNIISLYPDWITDGEQLSAEYGYSVSWAGDVNGDGFQDVLIGASKYGDDVEKEGTAFLFLGNPQGLDDLPAWTAGSGISGARFGYSVAAAGDVNCDGYDDVIIGAPRYNDGQSEEGAAFVYYGSRLGPSITPDWTVQGDLKTAWYGASVAGAGDVNGDGCDDVIVGAPLFSGGQVSEGAAYLYNGSSSGLATIPAWESTGSQESAMYGSAVSSAGDANGDGFDDVLVGAPYYEMGLLEEGRVYAYYGSASGLSGTHTWAASGKQDFGHFGSAVASAGDLNGDGYDEIAVGAPSYDNEYGSTDEGAVFVYYGSETGLTSINRWKTYSGQASSGFGSSVATAGDLDQDGYDEVIVGAPYYSCDQPYEGAAFIFNGSPAGLSSQHHWQVEGNKNDSWFGFSVSSAGDINQDGYDDLVVGAPMHRKDDKTIMGRVFVYLGLEGEDQPPQPIDYPLYLPIIRLDY